MTTCPRCGRLRSIPIHYAVCGECADTLLNAAFGPRAPRETEVEGTPSASPSVSPVVRDRSHMPAMRTAGRADG